MILARKILFYVFIVVYAVLCPLVILYSFGYIYSPQEQDISRTGLVHLDSVPDGASVYLEKSRFRKKTPATISGLNPGTYQVTVRAKGYNPWSRRTEIKPGRSLTFDHILLLPKNPDLPVIAPGTVFRTMLATGDARFLFLQKDRSFKDLTGYDCRARAFRDLPDFPRGIKFTSVYVGHNSNFIFFSDSTLGRDNYFFLRLNEKEPSLKDVTRLFTAQPRDLEWEGNNPKEIFAVYDDHADRLDVLEDAVHSRYFDGIKGFGLAEKNVYLLSGDNIMSRTTVKKKKPVVLFEDAYLGKNLFDRSRFYRIQRLNKETLVFWGDKGDLVTTRPPYRIAEDGVRGLAYNKHTDTLLYWTRGSIWSADFDGRKEEDQVFKGRVTVKEVYSGGKNITQSFPVYEGSHVLFTDGNAVFLLDLARGEEGQPDQLAVIRPGSDIFYDKDEGVFYYLDKQGAFREMRLLPKDKLGLDALIEE